MESNKIKCCQLCISHTSASWWLNDSMKISRRSNIHIDFGLKYYLLKKNSTNSENFFIAAVLKCFKKRLPQPPERGLCTQLNLHCLKNTSPRNTCMEFFRKCCHSGSQHMFKQGVSFGRPELWQKYILPRCHQFAKLIKLIIIVNNKKYRTL